MSDGFHAMYIGAWDNCGLMENRDWTCMLGDFECIYFLMIKRKYGPRYEYDWSDMGMFCWWLVKNCMLLWHPEFLFLFLWDKETVSGLKARTACLDSTTCNIKNNEGGMPVTICKQDTHYKM